MTFAGTYITIYCESECISCEIRNLALSLIITIIISC